MVFLSYYGYTDVKPEITVTLMANLSVKPDVEQHRTATIFLFMHSVKSAIQQ